MTSWITCNPQMCYGYYQPKPTRPWYKRFGSKNLIGFVAIFAAAPFAVRLRDAVLVHDKPHPAGTYEWQTEGFLFRKPNPRQGGKELAISMLWRPFTRPPPKNVPKKPPTPVPTLA